MVCVPSLLLLLAIAAPVAQTDAGLTTPELVAALVERGDEVRADQLEELARRGDDAAFDGLVRVAEGLSEPARIADACLAFAQFRGAPAEARAVALLGEGALASPSDPGSRPCARALARFGSRATPELLRVAEGAADRGARALAVGALAPSLIARPGGSEERTEAFMLVLREYRPPLSGSLELGAELLAALAGDVELVGLRRALRGHGVEATARPLAAAALVLSGDAEARAWAISAVDGNDGEVALAVLRAAAHAGVPLDARTLRALMRSSDARLVYAAALAWCRAHAARDDDAARRELERLTESRVAEERAAVACFLGERPAAFSEAYEERYLELVEDEDVAVRMAALDGLALRRTSATVARLVVRMEAEGVRMRARIREVLVGLTAQDHGDGAERWRAFWSAEGATFQVPSRAAVEAFVARRDAARARGATSARFFGLALDSDRVAFVFDTSGSMQSPWGSDGTRLEAVQEELARLLASFPEDGLFNLVSFSQNMRAYRRRALPAAPRQVATAVHWVRGKRARGGTNVGPALLFALEDRDIDTICVLTDGAIGTGGNEGLLAAVRAGAALRDVRILGVSFGGASPLLRALAGSTGGEYVELGR